MYLFYSCVTNLCNLTASRDINFIKIQMIKKKLAEVPPLILILKAKSGTGMHKTVITKAVIFCWLLHYNLGWWCSGVRNDLPLLQSLCLSAVYLDLFGLFALALRIQDGPLGDQVSAACCWEQSGDCFFCSWGRSSKKPVEFFRSSQKWGKKWLLYKT